MIKREIIFFEKPGAGNTQTTLEAVRERAKLLEIKKVVLATNSGDTALKAVDSLKELNVKIIAVISGVLVLAGIVVFLLFRRLG